MSHTSWFFRLVGPLGVMVVTLACSGNPIPLGPDLVACQCQCVTETVTGVGSTRGCGGICDPPCEFNEFCGRQGGCGPMICEPNQTHSSLRRVNSNPRHVCVDANDPSLAVRACQVRCDKLASTDVLQCLNGLLLALGITDVNEYTIPFDLVERINPNAARTLQNIIMEECVLLATDALTHTCGYQTEGVGALVDLLLCIWDPFKFKFKDMAPQNYRTCQLVPEPISGEMFTVLHVNGCPQFSRPTETGTPVGGLQLAATASVLSESSLVSISGADIATASARPAGTVSSGRLGPILVLSSLRGSLPDAQLVVQGRDVALKGGFFELRSPVTGVLSAGSKFEIEPGRLKFFATGKVNDRTISVEGANPSAVTGHYDEATGRFDLSGALELGGGLNATVRLQLTFGFTNRPPLANAGPDRTFECTLPTREGIVHLSAAESRELDPGDRIENYVWTLENLEVGRGPTAKEVSAPVGLGPRLATLTTTDTRGSTSRDTAFVTVVDTQPPVFESATADPACLWPPNHKMVLLRLGQEIKVQAHDACGSVPPKVVIKSVESNQPGSGGSPDFRHGKAAVCLRSEREGSSREPRIYKITLVATDRDGRPSERVLEVKVPHDQSAGRCPNVPRSLIVADDDPACIVDG